MAAGSIAGLPMPEHPVLRQFADEMERLDRVAQILDRHWRFVYVSSELWRFANEGEVLDEVYEMGHIRRQTETQIAPVTPEQQSVWWRMTAPYMRYSLEPGTPEFENAFGSMAERAAQIEPLPPPRIWSFESTFKDVYSGGAQHLVSLRIDDDDGSFLGVLEIAWSATPATVNWLLSLGDPEMYRRMAAMTEPHRCPAAVAFCDIEASGELSRKLSSRAYFDLIRSVTTSIDSAVAEHGGIVGKHAGDGASAFFCARDYEGSESAAARAAIETVRAIRSSVEKTDAGGEPVALNFGIHWGGTIVMGQVSEGGRLEVTALGDEVNEAARIEAAATGGTAFASKHLIERLEPDDASALGIDPDAIAYTRLGRLEGVSEKALRDAATIPVAEL